MNPSSRNAIIAGNWKMHYGPKQAAHFAHEIAGSINLALLKERIADFAALRLEKRIGHASPNQELINHADQSL